MVTGILIFKCTEGAGVGDYSSVLLAVSNGSKMTKTREKGKAKKKAEKSKEIR